MRRSSPARRRAAPKRQKPLERPEQPVLEAWAPPPFISPEEIERLAAAVGEAALNGRERRAFQGVLRRAFEDLIELEQLYAEVPGVLDDDPAAIGHFSELLGGLGGRGLDPGRIREAARNPLALKPIPDGEFGLPCRPQLAVGPTVIFAIGLAADRVWGSDRERFARTVDDLAGLWEATRPLEELMGAMGASGERRPDRLRGVLRRFVRDTRGGDVASGAAFDAPLGWEPQGHEPEGPGALGGGFGLGPAGGRSVIDMIPFGDPPIGWPPPIGPRTPPDLCALMPNLCKGMVYHGLGKLQYVPVSTHADGITGVQPATACASQQVTIVGSGFGPTKPPDVDVLIGTTVAPVVSWSDTAIVITIPAGATSGCVGFINRTLEAQRIAAIMANQEGLAEISEGLHCLGVYQTGRWANVPIKASKVPCTGFNFLRIGPPVVSFFLVNGRGTLVVTPGTALELSWSVSNAANVRIRRTSAAGPFIDQVLPATGTRALGAFVGTQPVTATYELTANNTCGAVAAQVSVQLAQPPSLGVVAIEVVQSIQTQGNTVRLVAGKRAIARVWVDSGITNGFNNGVGPNQIAVTGRLSITPSGGGPSVSAGPVLNAGGTINARPAAAFNRGLFAHSLNFELPLAQLVGGRRLDVTVFVPGREGETGFTATGSTTVSFQVRPTQEILPFFCTDSALGGVPNAGQFAISLAGARTRQPMSQTGFIVNPPIPIATLATENLTTVLGWNLLVTRLATMIFVFPATPVGGIRTAIVPNNGAYAVNGMAMPRFGLTLPAMISRATLPATYAHEMCHLAGVNHAPCGGPPPPIDPRLPGTIEDAGMDVPTRTVIPAGRGELMSLCGGQGRWPSIANYNGIMFNAFPI